MPTMCKFVDRKTDKAISLADLDEILCAEMGITPNEHEMCVLYELICLVGIAISYKSSNPIITQEDYDNHMVTHGDDFTEENRLRMQRFLVTDYKFEAWYSHR